MAVKPVMLAWAVAAVGGLALTSLADVFPQDDGARLRVDPLADRVFRVRRTTGAAWSESGLNRYGILDDTCGGARVRPTRIPEGIATKAASLTLGPKASLEVRSAVSPARLAISLNPVQAGFELALPLAAGERIYGLGDVSRDNIMRRPGRYDVWVTSVKSYIPIPVVFSSRGWGLLLNTTRRSVFDVGQADSDWLTVSVAAGEPDFYLFFAADYRGLLDAYTSLVGRPALLPAFGYGFTHVCNQKIDQFALFQTAGDFRREKMPCDVLGLEPGWMSKFYDDSTDKDWHPDRFYFPYWMKPGDPRSLMPSLARCGFKPSLWLCCNYDLFRHEEEALKETAAQSAAGGMRSAKTADEVWHDDRVEGKQTADEEATNRVVVAEGSRPWFEHLRKFVDQGVRCFKLDAAWQVSEEAGKPGRKWSNGMADAEAHNLYPVVYAKQMAEGFERYVGKRAMVYSAGGYTGVQRYVATWAGDTGGGVRPCASMLNLGLSGHPNQSCDMSVLDVRSLHFGMLQTWSQQNNWDFWEQPWMQEPAKAEVFRAYDNLRYRLFPYIYSAAAEAARTGWPILRALPMVYPENPAYDACKTEYLLGDSLLVSVFADEMEIPPGRWHDFRTGETVCGPCRRPVKISDDWGGSLFVKAGTVLPTWPVRQHLDAGWNAELIYEVWPTGEGSAELYEDDGETLDYRRGGFARTAVRAEGDGCRALLVIGRRQGAFVGMPAAHAIRVNFHLDSAPASAWVNGRRVEFVFDGKTRVCTVDLGRVAADAETRVELKDDLPGCVDGIYPHLAMFNDEGECGTGAVVPWAGSLWVVTYGPHCPVGSSDRLYQITADLRQIVRPESVGGTPANRLVHRETNQLLIGPYVIDAAGKVRVVPPAKMPGRLTGAARHLTDSAGKVYVATMETGLYELDMRTLDVRTLIRENGKNDDWIGGFLKSGMLNWPSGWEDAVKTRVPGYHAKGLSSGFGRVFVANNGEDSDAARRSPFVTSGVLAWWNEPGRDWTPIRRMQFTDIATRDDIYGNEHPRTNPVWALGWDAKSVVLAVTDDGRHWRYFRLPKGSHAYDGAHGWNTEWPRIRDIGEADWMLATMHGTFWRFPKDFCAAKPQGIRPLSTYLKVIGDFCRWGDRIVMGCDDQAQNEFLGQRALKRGAVRRSRSQSNLWFVKPEELTGFGPPSGEGWVWLNEDVAAGALSDPFLRAGYEDCRFTFVDRDGGPVRHELVAEGDWVRVRALESAKGVSARFRLGPRRPDALPTITGTVKIWDDFSRRDYRFPIVNGDQTVICREVTTERDLLYVGGVFYELPADNAGGFAALRPVALSPEPVRTLDARRGLLFVNGRPMALDRLWQNGSVAAYWLWEEFQANEAMAKGKNQ